MDVKGMFHTSFDIIVRTGIGINMVMIYEEREKLFSTKNISIYAKCDDNSQLFDMSILADYCSTTC
jgi:hypothetical protein